MGGKPGSFTRSHLLCWLSIDYLWKQTLCFHPRLSPCFRFPRFLCLISLWDLSLSPAVWEQIPSLPKGFHSLNKALVSLEGQGEGHLGICNHKVLVLSVSKGWCYMPLGKDLQIDFIILVVGRRCLQSFLSTFLLPLMFCNFIWWHVLMVEKKNREQHRGAVIGRPGLKPLQQQASALSMCPWARHRGTAGVSLADFWPIGFWKMTVKRSEGLRIFESHIRGKVAFPGISVVTTSYFWLPTETKKGVKLKHSH